MILFLTAMAMIFEVNAIGRLSGTEIIFILLLPFVLTKRRPKLPAEKWFYIMAFAWFLGTIATDIWRETPFDDIARGWSKIIFFIINFTVIRGLIGRDMKRMIVFIFFLFVASAIRLRFGLAAGIDINEEFTGDGWKFGYGQLATSSVLLLSMRLVKNPFTRLPGIILPYMAGALNLALNARNLAGLTILSAVTGTLTAGRKRALSPVMIVIVAISLALSGFALIKTYEFSASQGYLGTAAYDKYISQSSSKLGVLIGGRTEMLASIPAIIDSPILGHGSWAHDISYVKLMVAKLAEAGIAPQGNPYESDLIPTHSHLFGAWVESGILGAAFWFWAIGITLKGVYNSLRHPSPLTGFIAFIGFSLLWDILFSPFGLERRVVTAAWLYFMMLAATPEKPASPSTKEITL